MDINTLRNLVNDIQATQLSEFLVTGLCDTAGTKILLCPVRKEAKELVRDFNYEWRQRTLLRPGETVFLIQVKTDQIAHLATLSAEHRPPSGQRIWS